jgi:pimeloyl-ACP methyl ester carboxylesterase
MSFNTAVRAAGRRSTVAATLVIAIGSLAVAPTRLDVADAATRGSSTTPSIVLVHGAWADSGSWDAVVQRLQREGYPVYAPPNPLRGIPNDAETVADFLHTITTPIILVGHSYGGAVITNAATGNSQVTALVYVDAFVPAKGETLPELVTSPKSCFAVPDLSTVFNFVPYPGAPSGVFDAYVKPELFPRCFANGLPARRATALAATQRPLSTDAFDDASGVPAWKAIPSWAVIGTADHVLVASDQRSMARRAGARITKVDAPHLSIISDPDVVSRVIRRAAQATT